MEFNSGFEGLNYRTLFVLKGKRQLM